MDTENAEIQLILKLQGPDLDRDEVAVGRNGLRIGRVSENSLVLDHREVSRQHARIFWREDDRYLLEDLNSSNGVWLNSTRIASRVAVVLNVGDTIRIGPYLLRVDSLAYVEAEPLPRRILDTDDDTGPPEPPRPRPPVFVNGGQRPVEHIPGLPRHRSNWMNYLPAVFDEQEFIGRYLLIFESMFNPLEWHVDNFDLYLSPEITPESWLQWISSWFDLLMLPQLPVERQRRIVQQIGWLFLRRGTQAGLKRLLELYFDVVPEIIEDEVCHFIVRMPIDDSSPLLNRDVVKRLIDSQKPAFADYDLEPIPAGSGE